MKASEYRLGNYVFTDKTGDEIFTVSALDILKGIGIQNKDKSAPKIDRPWNVIGIPLTENWWASAGFSLKHDQIYNRLGKPIVETYWENREYRVYKTKDGWAICIETAIGICEVKYAHQLQNAWIVLTGEELKLQ